MLQAGRALYVATILGLAITGYTETFGELVAKPIKEEICTRTPERFYENKAVPTGALWTKETLREPVIPENYQAALAWINTATVTPCTFSDEKALVEIKKITLIEKNQETGEEKILREFDYTQTEERGFSGALFQREPFWFGPGEGNPRSSVLAYTNNGLVINIRQAPNNIYHGWTEPRIDLREGALLVVEAEVKVSGHARLQLGVDYWKDKTSDYNGYDPNCQTSNNCEGWIGDWQGDTKGEFIKIRSPKSLEIASK